MRKTQKAQICHFLELLKQIHKEIKKFSALDFLEDICAGIETVRTLIEQTEGKDCITISYLEQYSKEISYLQMEIKKESSIEPEFFIHFDKHYQNLHVLLAQIEDSVKNDIPIKKEVVFLPYKAAMWDSLESIWKEANEDPNCNAYVIPIPYFDKNADGSLSELHYEGDLYPKDVPITHYQDYDLEEQHPDQIFIHNPYDEQNLVTSVYPEFYSKKLKDVTDMLIYIPYFVLAEISPEDETAVENMAHFCKVPAVINADKVIVQSEQMKQVYVKVLTKWQGAYTQSQWEEKILGLGSPKEDKLLHTQKEKLQIPKAWKSIIEKSDGTNKKVIFYNTSLSAFLHHSDVYLEKLEDALQVFEEAKEEIALLWRPHPLMEATMQSMRPEQVEKYQKIVQKYKQENWGIYDNTPDLDRAICMADAYYGDGSSVVQLCQKAGIPVMIQNVDVRYD